MKDYKAYIYDFDLTLADSRKGIRQCFRYTFDRFDLGEFTDDEIDRTIGYELVEAFPMLTGCTHEESLLYKAAYLEAAETCMTPGTTPFEGVQTVLEHQRALGAQIAVFSMKRAFRIWEGIDLWGWHDLFDLVVGADCVSKNKPDPLGLNRTIELLGLSDRKEDVLYIGDSFLDAQTALRAKVDFMGVTTGTTDRARFWAYPSVKICDSLLEGFGLSELSE